MTQHKALTAPLLCLSVRQPYAERIATGEKNREFRTWSTDYRGLLLILAGKRAEPDGLELPRGVAVCVVELVAVEARPVETLDGEDRDGFAWVLRDPRRVASVPVRGKLGLFRLTLDRCPDMEVIYGEKEVQRQAR